MKQTKNYLKIGILFASILVMINSCEKEPYEEIPLASENLENDLFQTVSIQESLDFFSKRKSNKLQARELDALELEPDLLSITHEEILNTDVELTVIPAETKYPDIETRILQVKSMDGEIHSLLFNEIPDADNNLNDNFNGVISLTTIEGKFIEGFRVVDGNAVTEFVRQSAYSGECDESLNPNSIFCNQQLEEVYISSQSILTVNRYTSQSYNQGPIYPHYVWRYNNNGYYGYAEAYMKYIRSLPCDNPNQVRNENGYCVDNPDQIINNLKEKADCVYQKLKNNSLLSKTLDKFNGEKTPVHLILQSDDLEGDAVGNTDYGTSYFITITLDTNHTINNPSLDVANTILHEAIHADIFRKIKVTNSLFYDSFSRTYTLASGSRANFETLFDYYNNYPSNPHHNYMADYYRSAMEDGLREYASSIGKTYPDQIYKDLAWSGLIGTNAWNNMYADPVYTKMEQDRIKAAIINFIKSEKNECN